MRNKGVGRAPDYTNAAMIMLGVNLLWVLVVIWAWLGYLAALGTAWLAHRGIIWLRGRRAP